MRTSWIATTTLVVSAVGAILSDLFRSVEDEHGSRMCSTADPYGLIPRIRSMLRCASLCSLDTNCSYFNFWSETESCCLFGGPLEAIELIVGCATYEKVDDHVTSPYPSCLLYRPAANATLMQRKIDTSVTFNKTWQEFRSGFNDSAGNFWLGNEQIRNMTSSSNCSLYLLFTTAADVTQYAVYSPFSIGKNSTFYKLSMKYSLDGNITADPLSGFTGSSFSTFDSDHDLDSTKNCASVFKAGWWFGTNTLNQGAKCGFTNLHSYSTLMAWRNCPVNGTCMVAPLKCNQMWLMC